jgi:caa(3)-type oxidase subunit IV
MADHDHAHHESGYERVGKSLSFLKLEGHEWHYVGVWLVLVILLVASVIGPFVGDALEPSIGPLARFLVVLVTAFGIAVYKAWLVVKNFMHLTVEPKFVTYAVSTALVLMFLLFFFVAPDVMKHAGTNWENHAAMRATGELEAAAGPAAEFDAQETFAAVCAACHGATGGGDGPAGVALEPRPAAFTTEEFWETRDRERIVTAITSGGPAVGASPLMAAFGSGYTAAQIEEIADIVMGFRPEVAEPEPPPEVEGEGAEDGAEPVVEGEGEAEAVLGEPTEPAEAGPPPGLAEAEARHRAGFIRRRVLSPL